MIFIAVFISIILPFSRVQCEDALNFNAHCDIKTVDDNLNTYLFGCHKANKTKIGCCSVTLKYPFNGLHYEWGSNCIKPKNTLKDHINILKFEEPSETTCELKFNLIVEPSGKKITVFL